MISKKQQFLIGIDEAGRGPLAGPVSVGVVLVKHDFDWTVIPGVGDSKKVTSKNRAVIFELATKLKKEGLIDFQVSLIGADVIDSKGIVPSIKLGMSRCLNSLQKRHGFQHEDVQVKLDGSLKAPVEFIHQETIIKGDSKELCIGLASILAKVTRDQHMEQLGAKYPLYSFEVHKGYGTKNHLLCIKENGLTDIHRRSFCHRLT